jgi:hypothetical protein
VGIIWTSAQASLRWVLLGIVFIAALASRVSIQTAGRPGVRSSSCSHAVSEHASRPDAFQGKAEPRQSGYERLRLAGDSQLFQEPCILIDHVDRGLF